MATHDPLVPVEDYEWEPSWRLLPLYTAPLILCLSYEALPPNFTLLENCLAGAFAGIMVSSPPSHGGEKSTRS